MIVGAAQRSEIDKMIAMSDQASDLGQRANDLGFKANTLLEAGRADEARATAKKAFEFNGLSLNYGYVRGKAKALVP